jgi:hypothetical protein
MGLGGTMSEPLSFKRDLGPQRRFRHSLCQFICLPVALLRLLPIKLPRLLPSLGRQAPGLGSRLA